MGYFLTEQGNTFDENGVLVVMKDDHPTFLAYLAFLQNNGAVENYIGVHPMEMQETIIEKEYQRYLTRKADGECAYLKISAELRVAKLAGQISDSEHVEIETALEPVRAEIVLGQWIGAKQKLDLVGPEIIGTAMYIDLSNRITSYINDNY